MKTALVLPLVMIAVGCAPQAADRWAERMGTQHEEVDLLLDRGDHAGARRLLEAIVRDTPVKDASRRPLLQDAHYRLAQLALATGDPAGAERQADEGLALGDHGDLFTANLMIVRGAARERSGRGAAATADYERALAINEGLLRAVVPAR